MATQRVSAAGWPVVAALLDEELLPKDPNAVSFWRELLMSPFTPAYVTVDGRIEGSTNCSRDYEISDDQTILDLKMAIIHDLEARADHLKPQSLRVCGLYNDTGDWDESLIHTRFKDGSVFVQCTDGQTIAECKRGARDQCFAVDITSSAWMYFAERCNLYFLTQTVPLYVWGALMAGAIYILHLWVYLIPVAMLIIAYSIGYIISSGVLQIVKGLASLAH